jgi:hypothetical protein
MISPDHSGPQPYSRCARHGPSVDSPTAITAASILADASNHAHVRSSYSIVQSMSFVFADCDAIEIDTTLEWPAYYPFTPVPALFSDTLTQFCRLRYNCDTIATRSRRIDEAYVRTHRESPPTSRLHGQRRARQVLWRRCAPQSARCIYPSSVSPCPDIPGSY